MVSWKAAHCVRSTLNAIGLVLTASIAVVSTAGYGSQAESGRVQSRRNHYQAYGTDLGAELGPDLGRKGTPLQVQRCRSNGAPGQRLYVTDDLHNVLRKGPRQGVDVSDAVGSLHAKEEPNTVNIPLGIEYSQGDLYGRNNLH